VRARGPLLTMAAVGVLAAGVFVVSLVRTPVPDEVVNAGGVPPPATTASIPPTSTPPTSNPPTSTPPTPAREAVYIGHSSGNEVTVAVAVSGDKAAAYLCDGKRVEAWLDGTVVGERVDLEGRNGSRLTATLSETAVLGLVTVENEQLPFSAAVAGPPAGIYEGRATVDGEPNRIGWIVLPSGRQVGINNADGRREPAPELDPNDIDGLEIEGVDVEVQRIEGRDPVVPR
jgi:hypothetical protein